MDLIRKFEDDYKNHELAFQLSKIIQFNQVKFSTLHLEGKFNDCMIRDFIKAVNDKYNICHYVYRLLHIYAVYLKHGIVLIPFTSNKESIKLIKEWCRNLSIDYSKVKVDRYVEEYCIAHEEIVPEDDPCPYYNFPDSDEEDDCDTEFDYKFQQTKIIIHNDKYTGTLDELNFEWDDRYVDGGYIPNY